MIMPTRLGFESAWAQKRCPPYTANVITYRFYIKKPICMPERAGIVMPIRRDGDTALKLVAALVRRTPTAETMNFNGFVMDDKSRLFKFFGNSRHYACGGSFLNLLALGTGQ